MFQETRKTLGFRLLEHVAAPELLPKILEQRLVPYCRQYGLDLDSLLLDFVEVRVALGRRISCLTGWDGVLKIGEIYFSLFGLLSLNFTKDCLLHFSLLTTCNNPANF